MMSDTRCIVMRKHRFRETSVLLHVLSSDMGACSFVARGFFRKKSSFNSHLEIFSINDVQYRKRDREGLLNMYSASLIDYPDRMLSSTEHVENAYKILKIVKNTVPGEDARSIFNMTVSSIMELNTAENSDKPYIKFLLNYMIFEGILNLDQGENISLKKQTNDLFKDRLNSSDTDKLINKLERNLEFYG